MSVRAYLVREDVKIIDGLRYVHEDLEYLWNNWSEHEIFEILYDFCNDMTNQECIGEIEIVEEEWDRFKTQYEKSKQDSKIRIVVNDHKDAFTTLDSYFKEGFAWATIKLF